MDYILANLEKFWCILTTGGATGSNLFRANYVAIVGHAVTGVRGSFTYIGKNDSNCHELLPMKRFLLVPATQPATGRQEE